MLFVAAMLFVLALGMFSLMSVVVLSLEVCFNYRELTRDLAKSNE